MALRDEFRKFLFRGNVVDLAVAVVVGAAFSKIVSALVDDLVMPIVSVLLPAGGWRDFTVSPTAKMTFKLGHFIGSVVDFVIVSFVIFLVLVKFVSFVTRTHDKPAVTKACPECLENVPVAAKRCKFCTSALTALLLVLTGLCAFGAAPAYAQDAPVPKFDYGKVEEVKAVEWRAMVKGGGLLTGGNSQTQAGTLSGSASRKSGDDRFALDAAASYGRARNRVFAPADGMTISGPADVQRRSETATNNWTGRARYDRFFTVNNSVYLVGAIGADKVAGKKLFGGGQVGYSRQVYKDDMHLVVAELGYDLSFESYSAGNARAVTIHSGRVFFGDIVKLSAATGVFANVEALVNLNREGNAKDATDSTGQGTGVDSFKDTRAQAKLGLTTTLWKNVSFGFGFGLRYDQNPAPLAAPKGLVYGSMPVVRPDGTTGTVQTFQAFANKWDTLTEANLVVTFL